MLKKYFDKGRQLRIWQQATKKKIDDFALESRRSLTLCFTLTVKPFQMGYKRSQMSFLFHSEKVNYALVPFLDIIINCLPKKCKLKNNHTVLY